MFKLLILKAAPQTARSPALNADGTIDVQPVATFSPSDCNLQQMKIIILLASLNVILLPDQPNTFSRSHHLNTVMDLMESTWFWRSCDPT